MIYHETQTTTVIDGQTITTTITHNDTPNDNVPDDELTASPGFELGLLVISLLGLYYDVTKSQRLKIKSGLLVVSVVVFLSMLIYFVTEESRHPCFMQKKSDV